MRHFPGQVAAALIGLALLVGFAQIEEFRVRSAQRAVRRAALSVDSLDAVRDTARRLNAKALGLGDSLAVVQRRAVQVRQVADALDRALGAERAIRQQLAVRVASLEAVVRAEGAVTPPAAKDSDDEVRRGKFRLRQAPYSVRAEVELPREPSRGSMKIDVALDSIPVEVRVSCGRVGVGDVRPAAVEVIAPAWARASVGRVEQAVEVCSPARSSPARGWWEAVRSRLGVMVVYGASLQHDGAVVRGVTIGVGVRVWP